MSFQDVELTCGERIVSCLCGDPIDRLPYGIGIGWQPWPETIKRWKIETGNPHLDYRSIFGFDDSFAIPDTHSGIYPFFESKVFEENDEYIVCQNERGIIQKQRQDGCSIPEFIDYPIKNIEDWKKLRTNRLSIDCSTRIVEHWDTFRSRLDETGEAVQVGKFPYGIFGTLRDLMGVEEFLVNLYYQPALVKEMMHHLTELWISIWQCVAKEVKIDHIHIWEDMSGKQGSLISPSMVTDFMMPCYDKIADFAHSAGVRLVSVDTDGDCSELIPLMMEHGVNVFLPFEVQAGNNILEHRKLYPSLGIIGGLDKRALAGTKSDIDAEVVKAKTMCKSGFYVPSFDHSIPPDVPWGNYEYAAKKIKEICYSCC